MNKFSFEKIWSMILIVLIVFIVFLTFNINQLKTENNKLTEEISQLTQQINPDNSSTIITSDSVWMLEHQGITDLSIITDDLRNHTELIPHDAVLGGTMAFRDIYLLNNRWVYAAFDDGHINGYGLFMYTLNDNSHISWKILATYLQQ